MKRSSRFVSTTVVVAWLSVLGCGDKPTSKPPSVDKTASTPAVPAMIQALPDDAFRAGISVEDPPKKMKRGEVVELMVRVKNNSSVPYYAAGQPDGKYFINLGYHWLTPEGEAKVWDGERTGIISVLEPGKEAILKAKVTAPDAEGRYVLEFDLVQEWVAWFATKGSKTARFDVIVVK